jgi:hypothetical protein
MRDGLKMARARTMRKISFFSNLLDVEEATSELSARGTHFRHDTWSTHVPTGQVFHEKVVALCVIIGGGDAIMDGLEL